MANLNIKDPSVPTPQDEGLRMEQPATQSASWNSAAFDLGAGYAPDMAGLLFVLVSNESVNPAGSNAGCAQKLQQSDDGSVWVDAGASVAFTGTGIHTCTALVTKRYVRRAVTIAGAATNGINGGAPMTSESWLNPNARGQ